MGDKGLVKENTTVVTDFRSLYRPSDKDKIKDN